MRVPVLCLMLAVAGSASAQIYSYTDANGKTVYTNQPPANVGAKPVQLPPTNSIGPQKPVASPGSGAGNPSAPYAILAIGNLPDEEAMRANNGTFDIEVIIQPQLAPGSSLQLRLDGQPYGAPSSSTHFTLDNIDRGDHSLSVDVLMGDRVVQSSAPANFTIQRISTNSPARTKPTPRAGG